MLTVFKQIFTWWNQNVWNKIANIFFRQINCKDKNGNKYYESKSGRRWVIYNGEAEASNTNEWYSWMHHINTKFKMIMI